jgi:DNA polymerase III subunit delta
MMGDPLTELRDQPPALLYWIYGKERFLVDRAVNLLKDRLLEPATRDFNYDVLHAKECTPAKIINVARTLPMMARKRLVLVRDADELDAKELNQLIPYATAPVPETCLVFVADKADTKIKLFATLKKTGVLLKLDPMPERALPGFVRGEAQRRGLRCEAGAAEMIVAEVGGELGQLVDAVERLELFLGESRTIRPDDVEQVVAATRIRSVFELSDAIGEGSSGRALAALESLLRAREPALKILAMITRQVRLLLNARNLLDQRASRSAMMEALGLPPFIVEKIEAQARRFNIATLVAMHRAVHETDLRIKSSRVDDDRWMERLVLELVAKGRGPAGGAGATGPQRRR